MKKYFYQWYEQPRQSRYYTRTGIILYVIKGSSLKATIKIINAFSAETNFLDEPLKKDMNKAFEQFTARLISLPAKTVIEEGY